MTVKKTTFKMKVPEKGTLNYDLIGVLVDDGNKIIDKITAISVKHNNAFESETAPLNAKLETIGGRIKFLQNKTGTTKKTATSTKTTEKKLATEKKVAEKKIAAVKKATDKKIATEKKVAEKKIAAVKKATDKKIATEKKKADKPARKLMTQAQKDANKKMRDLKKRVGVNTEKTKDLKALLRIGKK